MPPKAIGINISTKFVYTAVLQKDKKSNRLIEYFPIRIPYILHTSRRLHYIRTFILDLIYANQVNAIAIRLADRQSARISYERIETEGVLNELTAQAPVELTLTGTLKNFAEILGISQNLNHYLSGKVDFVGLKNWSLCPNVETKEAVIAASAVLTKLNYKL